MALTFSKYFESYTNYHSFVDLLNLCREVSDYIYNNDIHNSQFFDSFKSTKNGYEILFNRDGQKNYIVDANKQKIEDQLGEEQLIDRVYEDIENLFSIIQNDEMIVNIKQIDETLKSFKDIMEDDNIKTFDELFTSVNESFDDELRGKLSETYLSLKRGILDLLDSHLNGDMTKLQDFMSKYIEPDTDEIIEGFIEDADIFDFYLKYQSDVDQILLDNNYYDEKPEVESLYDYVIDGTYDAVVYCMEEMQKELYDNN